MIRGTTGLVTNMGDLFTVETGDKSRSIAWIRGAGEVRGERVGVQAEVGAEQPELWQEPSLPIGSSQ